MKLRIRDVLLENEVGIMDYMLIWGKEIWIHILEMWKSMFKVYNYIVECGLIAMYYRIMRLQGPSRILLEL